MSEPKNSEHLTPEESSIWRATYAAEYVRLKGGNATTTSAADVGWCVLVADESVKGLREHRNRTREDAGRSLAEKDRT